MDHDSTTTLTARDAPPAPDDLNQLFAEAESLSAEIVFDVNTSLDAPPPPLRSETILAEDLDDDAPVATELPTADAPPIAPQATCSPPADALKDLLRDPDEDQRGEIPHTSPSLEANRNDPRIAPSSEFDDAIQEPDRDVGDPPSEPFSYELPAAPVPVADVLEPAEGPDSSQPRARQRALSAVGLLSPFRAAGGALLKALARSISLIDLPFQGLSEKTRNRMGYCGLATLIMGILAWILPAMLKSNPFEHLDTGVAAIGAHPAHNNGGQTAHESPAQPAH